jgi:hypothetical protein
LDWLIARNMRMAPFFFFESQLNFAVADSKDKLSVYNNVRSAVVFLDINLIFSICSTGQRCCWFQRPVGTQLPATAMSG